MDILVWILRILDTPMTTPTCYGWFHLLWLGLMVVFSVFLCLLHKHRGTKPHKVLLFVGILCILLEVYKQINYSFSYENGITFDYQWYAFPFQFCSTPMYVALLAGLFKRGKLHSALCSYLATFSMFAGLCVMTYPGDVFIRTIGINIQTMICHGAMVVLGVYLFYTGHVKTKLSTLWKGALVFAVCVALASLMNEAAFRTGLLERETFNMFYISPYCEPSLPVYSMVQNLVPYPLDLIIYIASFTLASGIILGLAKACKKIFTKRAPK